MKKFNRFIFTLLSVALLATPAAASQTIYLDANGIWDVDNAKLIVHSWGSADNDAVLTQVSGHIFKADIPDGQTGLLFKRLSPSCTDYSTWCNREGYWGKTLDQTDFTSGKNLCKITGWTEEQNDWCGDKTEAKVGVATCEWSTYGSSGGGDTPGGGSDPVTPQDYSTAVPSECTDVMLQAFYWNSHSDATYGTSKWSALQSQVSDISQYFQLVWLPPSCQAKDDMGYLPSRYSNQKSKMGTADELKTLIKTFHNGGTRVVADVVINHAGNMSTWINFFENDFGSYGKFSPTSQWITSDDEAKSADGGKYASQLGSNADDGQEDNRNYKDARDWDHLKSDVQNMCRAYLKYLKGSVGYDGYRFDYSVGYHVSHTNDYVSAAKPYISVMEYWVTNAGKLKTRIDQAGKNTMTFDFAQRDAAFQNGITKNNYSNLVKPGMRGQGYQKYAVTFVDNHDTFKRPDIGGDCGNKTDGSSINDKELIMQCNAYMLSMPGIPCVFYPHWYKYKSEIKAMIDARRNAGIHSESSVSETSGSGYYEATVTGKYGKVILYLGSSASKSAPSGYKQAVKGSKYAMYYTGTMPASEIEQAKSAMPMLDKAAPMYNIMGQKVDASYKGVVIQNGSKYLLQ